MKYCVGLLFLIAGSVTSQRAGQEDELITEFLPDFNCYNIVGTFSWNECDRYVRCIECLGPDCDTEFSASVWQCKLDYLYDFGNRGCNRPSLVDCVNRTRPGTTTASVITTLRTTTASVTTTRTTTTPATTISTTTANSATTTQSTGSPPVFVCPGDGNFPNPVDCSSFYNCNDGIPNLITCTPGLLFNPELGVCDYPVNVDCENSGTTSAPVTTVRTTTPATTTSTVATTTALAFDCPYQSGFFALLDYCGPDYIVCAGDVPSIQTCPEGFIFNPIKLYCDTPENVACFIDTNPT